MGGSWVRTITSPFRKACTIFGPPPPPHKDDAKKRPPQPASAMMMQHIVDDGGAERSGLHGDVMACGYEDVQVMWSMLDNKARIEEFSAS